MQISTFFLLLLQNCRFKTIQNAHALFQCSDNFSILLSAKKIAYLLDICLSSYRNQSENYLPENLFRTIQPFSTSTVTTTEFEEAPNKNVFIKNMKYPVKMKP